MTPETWSDVFNYVLLALGGAMGIGTAVALVQYHRTGLFPGQPIDDDGEPLEPPAVRSAWAKVVIGLIVGLWGLSGLVN